jgi:hypothetical protein
MTTRSELKAFVKTDIKALLTTDMPLALNDIYFGRLTRKLRSPNEIFLRWDDRVPLERDADPYIANTLIIELFRAVMEPYEQGDFQPGMERAGELLRDTYDGDGAIDRFQGAITRDVSEVNLRQLTEIIESGIDPAQPDQQLRISQAFALELKTWEASN